MNRFLTLSVVLLLGLVAAVGPASAGPAADTDVILFRAGATVGPVDNPNSGSGAGDGLYLLDPTDGTYPNQRRGRWHFSAVTNLPTTCLSGRALSGPPMGRTCSIEVSGEITPVAGIGAACGMSHGRDGSGTFNRYSPADGTTLLDEYALYDISWTTSAGGVIPVQGTYERTGPASSASKDDDRRIGPLVGLAALAPMQSCADAAGNGATGFNVIGVVAFL